MVGLEGVVFLKDYFYVVSWWHVVFVVSKGTFSFGKEFPHATVGGPRMDVVGPRYLAGA